jgi:predicted nucleic acid-binding protein
LESYRRWIDHNAEPVIALHAILEVYSVMTSIPPPRRLTPEAALQALEQNFAREAVIGTLGPEHIWDLLASLARSGFGGSRIYDALIAHSVAQAGASLFLTWNTKHFLSIAPAGLEVREP